MTLEEKIRQLEAIAESGDELYADYEEHGLQDTHGARRIKSLIEEKRQEIAWLRELQERRKEPEIVYCGACIHFQCNMRFDGSVPKGADAYECRRGCGGCDPMDYCSYGKRREGRTE